ncbi:MAG: YceI family protein [Flavobacteriales bacterium]|nr:YceI family protein [Flavobacteriales bacterium]
MKNSFISIALFSTMLFAACGGESKEVSVEENAAPEETAATTSKSLAINAERSSVIWRGEVAGVYGHDGIVNVKSGNISVENNAITGGEVVIDMTTIVATDSASYKTEGEGQITDLESHLTTADFFNTGEFGTSTFTITSVSGNSITGNLTVRGKTNEETFEATTLKVNDNGASVSGTLVFNRQNYDVAWVHYMKDMLLSDDIALNIAIEAGN